MRFPLVTLLVVIACSGRASRAQIAGPTGAEEVGVRQHLGAAVPLDIRLTDESGRAFPLSHYMGARPVLLQLVYFGCPMLCTQSLTGLGRAMNAMPESAGEQFDVLTVSFDPHENSELAAAKKINYLKGYKRPRASTGWRFLTGDADAIRHLTKSIGFEYHWDVRSSSFAHPSTVVVLTSDGRISHYIFGTEFDTGELHDALLRAGPGKIGAPAPAVFLYCLRYDPSRGKYSLMLSRVVQAGGMLTFASLAGFIGFSLVKERRRNVS